MLFLENKHFNKFMNTFDNLYLESVLKVESQEYGINIAHLMNLLKMFVDY